jgi:hypothetical protein
MINVSLWPSKCVPTISTSIARSPVLMVTVGLSAIVVHFR